MKQETEKPLDEQRRIVTALDGLPPYGDLRQAKVNALRPQGAPALFAGALFNVRRGLREEIRYCSIGVTSWK